MRWISRSLVSHWVLPMLALAAHAGSARAQADDPWRRLVLEADSIGPETPGFAPSRWTPCAATPGADSVRVTVPSEEFLFARRSLRTRGMFTYAELPRTGSGTFALRAILCDEAGRPLTFVVEREHRYFYLTFSVQTAPTYRALTLFTYDGSCLRWAEEHGRFMAVTCPGAGSRKC